MIRLWLLGLFVTCESKDIARLFFHFGGMTGLFFVFLWKLGRLALAFPGHQLLFLQYSLHNVLVTMPCVLMLLFVVVPVVIGGLGNLWVQWLIGEQKMAFPRLNHFSFWLLLPSLLLLMFSFLHMGCGRAATVDLVLLSCSLLGASLSGIASIINFVCTLFFIRCEAICLKVEAIQNKIPKGGALVCWWFMNTCLLCIFFSVLAMYISVEWGESELLKYIGNGMRLAQELITLVKSPRPYTSDVVDQILELDRLVVAHLRECKSALIVGELDKWPDQSSVRKRYMLMYWCCKAAHYAALVQLQSYGL